MGAGRFRAEAGTSFARRDQLDLFSGDLVPLWIEPDFLPLSRVTLSIPSRDDRLVVRIDGSEGDLDGVTRLVEPVFRPRLGEIRGARHANRAFGVISRRDESVTARFDPHTRSPDPRRPGCRRELRASFSIRRQRLALDDRLVAR